MKDFYDRIALNVPAGRKTTVQIMAKAHGMSVSTYINTLLRNELGLSEEEWKSTRKGSVPNAETPKVDEEG